MTKIDAARNALGYLVNYTKKGRGSLVRAPKGARISGCGGLEQAERQKKAGGSVPTGSATCGTKRQDLHAQQAAASSTVAPEKSSRHPGELSRSAKIPSASSVSAPWTRPEFFELRGVMWRWRNARVIDRGPWAEAAAVETQRLVSLGISADVVAAVLLELAN
jgi:hypothetical protein